MPPIVRGGLTWLLFDNEDDGVVVGRSETQLLLTAEEEVLFVLGVMVVLQKRNSVKRG